MTLRLGTLAMLRLPALALRAGNGSRPIATTTRNPNPIFLTENPQPHPRPGLQQAGAIVHLCLPGAFARGLTGEMALGNGQDSGSKTEVGAQLAVLLHRPRSHSPLSPESSVLSPRLGGRTCLRQAARAPC